MSYNPHAPDWHKVPPSDISLREYADAWIDMAPHVDQLTELAREATVIVEFGLRGAVSTWAMLEGLPEDGQLYGVDIVPDARWYVENNPDWTLEASLQGYVLPMPDRVRDDPRFTFVCGNSLSVELPAHADLVMIDSSHEFAQTVAELMRAASLVPDVITLHDYNYPETPGVKLAVDGYVAKGYLRDEPYYLDIVHPSRWGLAVLRRR